MHHSDYIALIASIYKPKVYVELGLYEGETFKKVRPHVMNTAYGVDYMKRPSLESLNILQNTNIIFSKTDDFFNNFNDTIDMAFIDACHNAHQVMIDFDNCFKRLNRGGVIFLHDTDPESNHLFSEGYCGDSYKIVPILENRDDINIITLPLTEAGLSMITLKNDTRTIRRN
jgi:hypothetical protein